MTDVIDRVEVRTCQIRDCDFESGRLPDSSLYAGNGYWLETFVCPEHRHLLCDLVLPAPPGRNATWFACRCGDENEAKVRRARELAVTYYRLIEGRSIAYDDINRFLYALDSFGVRSVEVLSDQWAVVVSRNWDGRRVSIACDDIEDGLVLSFMGWVFLALMQAMRME